MKVTTIGLDIAKSVFQVHGEDAENKCVLQKRLTRGKLEAFFGKLAPCQIGIEACGSAHYWARQLQAMGHEVRLIPPSRVKPFVMRNKTDARDAAAICVAMKRPDTLFVAIKSPERQAMRGLERTRELLVKQRTQLANCLRSLFAEFGVIATQGKRGFAELLERLRQPEAGELPPAMQLGLRTMAAQIEALDKAIAGLDAEIAATAQQDPLMRLLSSIPSIGPITAHAIVAAIGDGKQFRSARSFAAWCGLTARVNSSGNKQRSGGISRQGDFRLRKLLALGASSLMRYARNGSERATQWQRGILARRPVKVAVIAQAAKTARIAWAVLRSGECYRQADRPDVGLSRAAA